MFNRYGRSRPNASGFGAYQGQRPATIPQSAAVPQTNSSLQAQYKPDFLASKSSGGVNDQTQASPDPTPITSSYQQARAALADPLQYGGPMTEKQTRELNWHKREDPIGFRDQMLQNQRIYGAPPQQPLKQLPTRPTNFNGPSKRFGA